jgi:hypothetical protein
VAITIAGANLYVRLAAYRNHKTSHIAPSGRRTRELRERAQPTPGGTDGKVEIGATYISQVENGHRDIRWHTLFGSSVP